MTPNVSPAFSIRPASDSDVPALGTVIEESVRRLQKNEYSTTQIDAAINSIFGIDRQLIVDQTYFVAAPHSDPTQIVACGGWSYRRTLFGSDKHTNRDPTPLNPASEPAKIRAIFVRPDFARQGLGTLILAHCEAAAHAAGFTRLEMGSTLTGLALYKLRGYVEQERVTPRLPNGEELEIVLMQKKLA